jgi:ABC-2 type transport system ATP-binding protein
MTPLFQLTDVTHFYGQVRALHEVSLAVEPGAIGLVGQNGAGKSTLMQILLGLIRPSRGTAQVLGLGLRASGIHLRGRIGYMPERDAMVPGLNGIEYAALAGELCGMSRKQALRRAHETLSRLGMEDARYRRLEQYSVGMKQRMKLAATLVHDPDVLLLDEPTAGLDPDGRADMLSLLSSLAARPNKSLVLSSHLLGDVERVCNSAVVLDRGQVVGTGRIEDMCRSHQTCYRIRWQGEGDGFLTELGEDGCDVRLDDRPDEARVVVPHDWSTRTFFATAGRHSVLLTGLEPEEEDFEAVYHRLISDNEH